MRAFFTKRTIRLIRAEQLWCRTALRAMYRLALPCGAGSGVNAALVLFLVSRMRQQSV